MKNRVELNDEILLGVRKPARYIGMEHNSITKDWDRTGAKVCLCYPDVYEIGMSHLGLKVLYHILNKQDGILCERSFAPWHDMEEVMRQRKIPLFSLESRTPLSSFDIIGFSLQYELTYTNLLNMLDLAGLPLESSKRTGTEFPLIIAGGPSAFNPEPLADFVDLFLLGDGEEAILEIVECYRHLKEQGKDRNEILREMAKIEGVYVPSLYDISYAGDKIEAIRPVSSDIPDTVTKRTVKSLRSDDYPTSPIVPYISTIHDRISLEIMRGCAHNCRFCQARSIYGPPRMRKTDELIDLARESYKNTGFDELSLVSLSSSSYPHIKELINSLTEIFAPLGVGIALPSLRVEEDLEKLPSLISMIKKSGLTFAPEAGTEKMLGIIKKNIQLKELFDALRQAYKMGWRKVKLYFMIGLPQEDDSDLEAIIDLADKLALLKKESSRSPAEITISVSSLIPKPHTPFQWMPMTGEDELKRRQRFLLDKVRGKRYLRLKMHDVKTSVLEGIFSRGDRRLGPVLRDAWKSGARFDAWSESFNPAIWEDALLKNRIDKDCYLRMRDCDEILPWERISCGMSKDALVEEHKSSLKIT